MASGTNYSQEYGQAEKAYLQGNFAQAATTIDHLAEKFPDDPNVLLLRGHIYCYGLKNYDLAQQQYESVLGLSQEQDLLDFARSGIEQVKQLQQQSKNSESAFDESNSELTGMLDSDEIEDSIGVDFPEENEINENFHHENFNLNQDYRFELNDAALDSEANSDFVASGQNAFSNPFSVNREENLEDLTAIDHDRDSEYPFVHFEQQPPQSSDASKQIEQQEIHNSSTFMIDSEDEESFPEYGEQDFPINHSEYENDYDDSSELEIDTVLTESFSMETPEEYTSAGFAEQDGLDYQEELEFDEIDSSFFDLEELEQGLPDTGLFNMAEDPSNASLNIISNDLSPELNAISSAEISVSGVNAATNTSLDTGVEPEVEVKQGALAGFINAPMPKKQLITAGVTGIVSALAVLTIGIVGTLVTQDTNKAKGIANSAILSLVAGLTSFSTAGALGNKIAKQVDKTSRDLQTQFDDVYQGNFNAKATVYSQDEFGKLATGFNRMTRVILTTTQEAQRRAEETEQAKEDLQRQVIRLLDDVEGAARGDLTVQATVTADVLGAVADAFNLTIQSLREIVRQVKEAAEQVNKGSTDSELFARNQSSEALRMAEELAVTLNSVQMMTESIERVAENAREAEEVARSSSVTALKGGKAVERTVSGIFQIRETVSETARKVKRLAEASQEISKIVLLISQIAERTNQLALNASIQAAKAGEAGRGFAVVADEVRQLADRSGKSLKEIEQIVLQIQSETGSVMTAMEEGIQEVIDVTDRAEQAKTALEDIIQVSNRIDTLVRSITADTVEQRENSRAVAQVMQSVELTAQATSQESQRVGGALQSLVGIARGLLSSVERFRIDQGEE